MSVSIDDYTTVQGLARIVKIPTPRAHRLVKFIGIPTHRLGRQILVRRSFAERVRTAVETNEFPPGPKKGSTRKKRGLALRAAPKRRVTQ